MGYKGTFEECTVEHCLSDSQSEENSVIGNLMLLEAPLNDSCGSKNITTKCQYYEKSSLRLPHIVVDELSVGKGFSIENRSNWIAETLYNFIVNIEK